MQRWDYEQTRRYLMAMQVPLERRASQRVWVDWNVPRFLRTLDLVPPGGPGERCLEIGSSPHTFTLLMRKLRPYELLLVDYYAGVADRGSVTEIVRLPAFGEEHRFESAIRDVERQPLPYADASIEGVLCCEVLEHLTQDPVAMLAEIHRVLRPDGWLVMTTPNVARLRNALNLLHGRNVYDPYERVCGPTWRHNREYTPGEVEDLLTATGFVVEQTIVEDADPPFARTPLSERLLRRLFELVYRQNYGAQIYVRARRGAEAKRRYPDWLYQHQLRAASSVTAPAPQADHG
jgi:SAM-dependent methyltransferase